MKDKQGKALEKQAPSKEIGPYEHRVRTVLAGVPAGIIVSEVESGRVVFANETMCRMLGYDEGECLALQVEDLHPDGELPRAREELEKMVRGESSIASDVLIERKDGSMFPADFRGALIELDGRRRSVKARKETAPSCRPFRTSCSSMTGKAATSTTPRPTMPCWRFLQTS
ncbi:MAG: PAS domain-containing protein [Myxococcota bacterium]